MRERIKERDLTKEMADIMCRPSGKIYYTEATTKDITKWGTISNGRVFLFFVIPDKWWKLREWKEMNRVYKSMKQKEWILEDAKKDKKKK